MVWLGNMRLANGFFFLYFLFFLGGGGGGIGSSLLLWTNGSADDDLKNVNKCFSRFVVHGLATLCLTP